MTKIVNISVRSEDEYIIDEIKALDGTFSGHMIAAAKEYLKTTGKALIGEKKYFWYVEGKDYSHMSIEIRRELNQLFGYTDKEIM